MILPWPTTCEITIKPRTNAHPPDSTQSVTRNAVLDHGMLFSLPPLSPNRIEHLTCLKRKPNQFFLFPKKIIYNPNLNGIYKLFYAITIINILYYYLLRKFQTTKIKNYSVPEFRHFEKYFDQTVRIRTFNVLTIENHKNS